MIFSDFVGNEKLKDYITYQTDASRLPHAIILEGESGLGKRTFANEIAMGLLCRGESKPCRKCAQCSKVLHGVHPDVWSYAATGAPQSFKVAKVREIIEDVIVRPNEADCKVYILANCQGMNASAQNALLKVIEEPPSYAFFILTVTNKSALLPTVLSRCVVLTLKGVESRQAADYVCSRLEKITHEDAVKAANIFAGNIGKMLESFEAGDSADLSEHIQNICTALLADSEYELLKVCSVFRGDRALLLAALAQLKLVFRDALVYTDGGNVLSGQPDCAKVLASSLNKKKLMNLINSADRLLQMTVGNGNNSILITKICYDFRRAINR